MPENNEKPDDPKVAREGGSDDGTDKGLMPPAEPPSTTAPVQNTQINIQQIPPQALDKLSPEQILELHNLILEQMDRSDSRQFEFIMDQASKNNASQRRYAFVGGYIALAGIAVATYLAAVGNESVAIALATSLATIIAVVVGSRIIAE